MSTSGTNKQQRTSEQVAKHGQVVASAPNENGSAQNRQNEIQTGLRGAAIPYGWHVGPPGGYFEPQQWGPQGGHEGPHVWHSNPQGAPHWSNPSHGAQQGFHVWQGGSTLDCNVKLAKGAHYKQGNGIHLIGPQTAYVSQLGTHFGGEVNVGENAKCEQGNRYQHDNSDK